MLLLRRLLSGPICRHLQTLIPTTTSSSPTSLYISNPSRILLPSHFLSSRCLSTFGGSSGRDGDGNDVTWKLTPDADDTNDIFGSDSDVTPTPNPTEPAEPFAHDDVAAPDSDTWSLKTTAQEGKESKSDIFGDIYGARKKEGEEVFGGGGGEEEEKPWSFGEEEEGVENLFGGDGDGGVVGIQGLMGDGVDEEVGYDDDSMEKQKKKELAAREEELKAILKGDVFCSNFG